MSPTLTTGRWVSAPVGTAHGFWQRWRGLRPHSRGRGLILRGRRAHTFGMRESLWLVGLTRDGRVTEVRFVPPRRAVTLRLAELILELPAGRAPPPIQAHLRQED